MEREWEETAGWRAQQRHGMHTAAGMLVSAGWWGRGRCGGTVGGRECPCKPMGHLRPSLLSTQGLARRTCKALLSCDCRALPCHHGRALPSDVCRPHEANTCARWSEAAFYHVYWAHHRGACCMHAQHRCAACQMYAKHLLWGMPHACPARGHLEGSQESRACAVPELWVCLFHREVRARVSRCFQVCCGQQRVLEQQLVLAGVFWGAGLGCRKQCEVVARLQCYAGCRGTWPSCVRRQCA